MSGRRRFASATIALCLLVVGGNSSRPSAEELTLRQAPDVASAIRAVIDSGASQSALTFTGAEQRQLISLYDSVGYGTLWVDRSGRPGRDAQDAIRLLNGADTDGLDPVDYNVGRIQDLGSRLWSLPGASAPDVANFDVSMSANTLRYLAHLHFGRVTPQAVGFRIPTRERQDLVVPLRRALAEHRIPALAAQLTPSIPHYRQLRGALTRYRFLAANPELRSFTLPKVTVRPGDPCASSAELFRLLDALGDLRATESGGPAPGVYLGSVVDGVKRFQLRHGLEPDGVLGKETRAALSVPLAWRVRQIELALERLRWIPDTGESRFLAVNIPMFRVWGIEPRAVGTTPPFSTEVIVGRALNTQTPVLVEEMEHVIFRPYWNVPSSILRHEILPAVRRNPEYLKRHNMEVVDGQSDGATIVAVNATNLERARQGVLRVRQRPGPNNSLGLVKFVFPNDANVYMHGTPAQELFSRARRDFSHGCIRVADPVGLAEWVLSAQPEWTRDRILTAMNGHASLRVELTRSIPVILFYITTIVMPADGTVHFVEDIYGHDARLDQSLTRRRTS